MTDLKLRLEQHALWLSDNSKGKRFVATLNEDLHGASLQYASLQYANLQSANLRSANLRSANLHGASLQYANLQSANLQSANLQSANLHGASLRSANLQSANLQSAYLQYANLSDVNGFKFPPLQIVNTKYFITILGDKVLWGCRTFTFDEVKSLELKDCTDSTWDKDEFKLNKKIVTEMIRYYRKGEYLKGFLK